MVTDWEGKGGVRLLTKAAAVEFARLKNRIRFTPRRMH